MRMYAAHTVHKPAIKGFCFERTLTAMRFILLRTVFRYGAAVTTEIQCHFKM